MAPKTESKGYAKTDIAASRAGIGGGGTRFENEYQLKEGKHLLFFLPPKEPGPFYYKYFYHKVGREWPICPKNTWGTDCPVCTFGNRLFNSKDPDEVLQGKALWRKESFLANVVDVNDPTKVQVLRFGPMLAEALKGLFIVEGEEENVEPLDFTDPENGAYIRILTTKNKGDYANHAPSVGARNKTVPFKKWLKELHDLKDLIKKQTKSAKELQAMMLQGAVDATEETGVEDDPDLNAGAEPAAAGSAGGEDETYFCTECEKTHEANERVFEKHKKWADAGAEADPEPDPAIAEPESYFCTECEEDHSEEDGKVFEKHKKWAGKKKASAPAAAAASDGAEYYCTKCKYDHDDTDEEFKAHKKYAGKDPDAA